MSSCGPIPSIYPPALERRVDGQGGSAPGGGQKEEDRSRVQEQTDHQDEPAEDILVARAEQCCEVPHRAQVGLRDLPVPVVDFLPLSLK
jgi:hypothetical protein